MRRITTLATILLAGLGILVVETSFAVPQQDTSKPKQTTDKTETKKPEEKKPPAKTIDIQFKVSVKDSRELPPDTKVEISGREGACGSLQTDDLVSVVNESGEAVFKGLPQCKVTVKVNRTGYLLWKQTFDLADYKGPIHITLEPEQ